ncbi:TasA family protein [Chloroflexota bacterium]
MKKIVGLAITALLVMGLVGGGTWAYFSDVEVSTGNVLSAGTLDLTVNGGNSDVVMLTLNDKIPGDNDGGSPGYLTLKNIGSAAGDLTFKITAISDDESTGISGTATGGSISTVVDTALTEADDYWNGYQIEMTSGAANGDVRTVTDFVAASDTITVDSNFTGAVVATDTYFLFREYERDATGGAGVGELGDEMDISIWIDTNNSGSTYQDGTDVRIDSDGSAYSSGSLVFDAINDYGVTTWTDCYTGLAAGSELTVYVEWDFVNEASDQNAAQGDSVTVDFEFELTQ